MYEKIVATFNAIRGDRGPNGRSIKVTRNPFRRNAPAATSLALCVLLAGALGAAPQPPPPPAAANPETAATPDDDAAAAPPASDVVEEVTIFGELAGPGLWKVRNGDNTLYLLGTLSPLPKKLQWRSREVENVLGRAKQVIPARSEFDVDIGPIRAVQLYFQYRELRGNADRQTLQEVLPADLFARFEALRSKYAPRERSLLQRRPLLAAGELWREAVSRSGLTSRNDVNRAVEKLAKARKVPLVMPKVVIDDPKGILAEVGQISVAAELACMRSTLARLEVDLAAARQRAEAWAVGDVEALRSSSQMEQQETCWEALQQSAKVAAIRTQFEASWLKLAVEAVERHDVSLAVVPISILFGRQGVLELMRERGYTVDDP